VRGVDISVLNTSTLKWKKIGSVLLSESGIVTFTGLNKRFIAEMNTFGVVGNSKSGQLFPSAGAAFMDALVEETGRCSMVRATTR
jgi:hypothetical protein